MLVFGLCLLSGVLSVVAVLPIQLDDGIIVGREEYDRHGRLYYSFRGIPYAKPPVGELRFRPPQPNEPWFSTRTAFEDAPTCPQNDHEGRTESEDCLYVNVYTKHPPGPNLKPVLFYIYGGGFVSGWSNSTTYGPENLIGEDVIIVTFNYRVGLPGFLKLNDTSLKIFGNMGLKDQRLAMKWVQKNIQKFGGNPKKVTIAGNSAGAMSVHAHLLSPSVKGLFHQCIIQSGVATYINFTLDVPFFAQYLNQKLGFRLESDRDALAIFNASTAGDMFIAATNYSRSGYDSQGLVVEDPESPDPFLSETPLAIMERGTFNDVPCMIGYLDTEGIERYELFNQSTDGWFTTHEDTLDLMLGKYDLSPERRFLYKKKLLEFYFSQPHREPLYQFFDMGTDVSFLIPTHDVIQRQLKKQKSTVYVYRFGLDTHLNLVKNVAGLIDVVSGAGHGDELGYIFYQADRYPKHLTLFEYVSITKMTTLWSNYIKTGNPNEPNQLEDVYWLPMDHNGTKVRNLRIEPEMKMADDYVERMRIDFWEELRKLDL